MTTVVNRPYSDSVISLAERTARVDRLVIETAANLVAAPGIAALAVGGYGRRQLFPHSDVDLLLLFESDRLALAHKETISAFLQRLWDSGVRVSHSVRTPDELSEVHDHNIELDVSLLDQRYLAGDRSLYAELARRLPRFIHASREPLIRNLAQLTRQRHSKYAGTFYHLEPNLKDTPGGLRDYQLICWIEKLHQTGEEPGPELQEAFQHFARLRCFLHGQSGRDNNVLSFDAQDAIAEQWRDGDSAALMREHYRYSRSIFRAAIHLLEANEAQSSALFAQFRDWRARVSNADFSVHRERAHFRSPQRLDVEPGLVLRLFEFVARHGIRIALEAAQRIEARIDALRAHFAGPGSIWPELSQIFTLPHAPLAVRSMHETGVLSALFPELEQIECLVVRDFYHRYTVDEHTLVALEKLCGARGSYASLLAEVRQPAVLIFALLFHDSGKGSRGEGHVDASVRLARGAAARIGMPEQDRETVLFLIGKHLDLSAALQSRDVFDPQTICDVAHEVGTVERLKALTLLTYADIGAVNPGALTPWRAEQLWQLYLMVYNELTRELETDRIESAVAGPPEGFEFLRGFPTRYLRTHTKAEIHEHMAL